MKSCAAGLSVRFFKVTMPTGQGSIGGSTRKALRVDRGLKCIMLPGRVLRKRPGANIFSVSCIELVVTVARGGSSLLARKALARRCPGKLSGGDRHHGSFTRSESLI